MLTSCVPLVAGCVPERIFYSPALSGRVISAESRKPVSSATVSLVRYPDVSVKTEPDGSFILPSKSDYRWCVLLPDACMFPYSSEPTLSITVRATGYRDAVYKLDAAKLESGEGNAINIVLERNK